MKVSVHINAHQSRKRLHTEAMMLALDKMGFDILPADINDPPHPKCEFAVVWGNKHPVNAIAPKLGMPVLILERPFFGDRNRNVSLGWNNPGRAAIRPLPMALGRRKPKAAPWVPRDREGYLVVFDQVPTDIMFAGAVGKDWAKRALASASKFWNRWGYVRPHPQMQRSTPLHEDLEKAWLGITYSSTAAVDCVLAGVPCITASPLSMAWDVTGHYIETIVTPEREEWLHWLSYAQWSHEELVSGDALDFMLTALPDAKEDLEKENRRSLGQSG
jgi:hypothetical protein